MKKTKFIAAALSCALLLGGCGVKGGDVVMNVGGIDVNESEFSFFLDTYRDNLDLGAAKETSLEYCEKNHEIVAVAKAMGIEFDEETQKNINDYKKQVVDTYDSDKGYKKFLKEKNLTDEYIDRLVSVGFYAQELEKKLDEKEYTDEEKQEYFKEHYRRAKHILLSTKDMTTNEELPEDKQAEAKTKAEELLSRAQNGEDFDALVSEFSEDPGSKSNPDGYVFTDNEMVAQFQDGVDSIGFGEFTLVKSDFGYHVIQRLPLDDNPEFFDQEYQKAAANLPSAMDNERFEKQVDEWMKEYGLEVKVNQDVLDSIE